jgi:hypothetical protein
MVFDALRIGEHGERKRLAMALGARLAARVLF